MIKRDQAAGSRALRSWLESLRPGHVGSGIVIVGDIRVLVLVVLSAFAAISDA